MNDTQKKDQGQMIPDDIVVLRRISTDRLRKHREASEEAKRRADLARRRYENVVAVEASLKPTAVDWYEHPATLTRKQLLDVTGLTTVQLHRIIERYQREQPKPKRRRRKP
jgi:hypothetical protein